MKFPHSLKIVCAAGFMCVASCCVAYAAADADNPPSSSETVLIPGPLRSFLRMAGISQEVAPDDVIPMLARNSALYGYQGGRETEFLVLVDRYIHQARELQQMADASGTVHIAGCEDATKLVDILGYRIQHVCGQKNASLMTANPERAFLTIDSGFPLTVLEQSLQQNQPFSYTYPATRVPVFFKEQDWLTLAAENKKNSGSLIDMLLHDQDMDRLYWALAKCDQETRRALVESPGLKRLLPLAAVFDLYGSGISIRNGKVVLPVGSDKDWEDLAGANPNAGGDFVIHLLTKDRGWLAAYFDTLARLNQAQRAHLADADRLKRLYNAYRSTAAPTNAANGVFPKNAELLVLFTSLKWDASGNPQLPEDSGVWQEMVTHKTRSNGAREWNRHGHCCDTPERLLETLVASANMHNPNGPLQVFLMLSAINAARPSDKRLSQASETLVADRLADFNRWFAIFAEYPTLDDTSIARFVSAADKVDGIANPALRANALGALQANIGLWQIFARQRQIPEEKLNESWRKAVEPFISVSSSVQLFEAARNSLQATVTAAGGNSNLTQEQLVDLLAGPAQDSENGRKVHQELAERMRAVLDDQRLVSLDTLFGLYDGLTEMSKGSQVGANMLILAGNLREFEMPRPIFSGSERSSWSPVVYTSRHAELQVRTDLTKILRSPGAPAQLESARGQLTPFLRDTLVGLNYAYYEPPGAEVLHNNPLFVRSHDFSSVSVQGIEHIWGVPDLIGVGATAGGGAYLMGSLADLPYALASAEEDFIAPANVQALIWKEAVPDLLVDAILPRWWAVSRIELHSAAVYQRAGEELLSVSGHDADLRSKVLSILSDRMAPNRLEHFEAGLKTEDGTSALVPQMLPADAFYLAVEFRKRYPDQASQWGPAAHELDDLLARNPTEASPGRIAADFGVPHPALALTDSCSLLNMKPLPAFGGNASRLLAESWESNNLYWARLADEMGYSPVMLNVLVPALTRRMISNIFASNIDDWPALLRAMKETGEEFRQGKINVQPANLVARQ